MRTLSKLGLAGIRLGALIGPGRWLGQLDKVRLPYNVNTLTQIVAGEVLQHGDVLTEQAAAIKLERGRLLRELRRLPGVTAYPSDANFISVQNQPSGARFRRTETARSADQESPRFSSPARGLPAGDGRHAGRERRFPDRIDPDPQRLIVHARSARVARPYRRQHRHA